MESSSRSYAGSSMPNAANLEQEIIAQAYEKPLFTKFNVDDTEKYIRMMMTMKTQLNAH